MLSAVARPAARSQAASLAAGDFEDLVRSEQRRIFLLALRMLGDPDEADTLVQDVFLKAFKAMRHGGEAVEDPRRWLTRATVNAALDRLRSPRWLFWNRRRLTQEDEQSVLAAARDPRPDAEQQVLGSDILRRLEEAMKRLSPRQRAVFVLRHYEDRSLEEISEMLGLEVGTVKAHLARAVAKLRYELRDLYWGASSAGGQRP